MNEDQVKKLMETNDDLLKQKTINEAAHERNKDIIVAAFVDGRGPPLLEGQPGYLHTAGSGTLRNRTLSHTDLKSSAPDGVETSKPSRQRRHSDADQVPHKKRRDKKKEPKTDPVTKKRGTSVDSSAKTAVSRSGSAKQPRKNPKIPKNKEVLETKTEPKPKEIKHGEWFSAVTGCDEKPFCNTRDRSFFENKSIPPADLKKYGQLIMMRSQLDVDRIFSCGHFKLHMYGDLLLALGFGKAELRKQAERNTKPCLFEVVTRADDASLRYVDVAHLQTLKENNNAVFQIASNFNAVEAINETASPDRSGFTEMYFLDRTQGPAASISAGAGAIARVHAPFYNAKKPHTNWCQTVTRQVNFVGDKKLAKHFPITNGYVIYTGNEPKFPKEDSKKWKKLLSSYLVAYHRGQQVTFGHRTELNYEVCGNPDQHVDQVCCAAVNMQQGRSGHGNKGFDPTRIKMRFILQAVYHSTYMSAIYNGREKLFLTLVGGGAFGNEIDEILMAIQKAHLFWTRHSMCKLQKVVLVLFGQRKEIPTFLQDLVNVDIPVSFQLYTKGIPEAQPVPTKDRTAASQVPAKEKS